MDDASRYYVKEAPRQPGGRLFTAPSVAECLTWVRARSGPWSARLAIWAAIPPPDEDADAAICLPISAFEDWAGLAATVVDRWEASWLLIESAPRRHREEARRTLVELVAGALATAAATGLDHRMDVGF